MPLPNSGYVFESSSCTHDATVEWDNSKWAPLVTNLTQTRTKCTLYFTKAKTVNTVLGELEVYDYTPDFTKMVFLRASITKISFLEIPLKL